LKLNLYKEATKLGIGWTKGTYATIGGLRAYYYIMLWIYDGVKAVNTIYGIILNLENFPKIIGRFSKFIP